MQRKADSGRFRWTFVRIASTIRSTNFENSNANIFYFASSFLGTWTLCENTVFLPCILPFQKLHASISRQGAFKIIKSGCIWLILHTISLQNMSKTFA
jgi:hypothetical protein